jgi:hypothetical protein
MSDINFKGHKCLIIDQEELRNAPYKTNDPSNSDSNNGLMTNLWGPPTWESFHAITFGYPINPTEEQKQDYMNYFTFLGKVLPCIYCRVSYQKFINDQSGSAYLNIDTMKSRETLTRWGFALHNAVNNKLGVDYGDTYEELCYKYESYRAKCSKTDKEKGCVMPLDWRAKSYQKASLHRAPIVDIKYCLALADHAKKLGMTNYLEFVNYHAKIKRNSPEWGVRDCNARRIIGYMRRNGVSSLDSDGLPSFTEMMLIAMHSTTLEKERLDEIYRLVTQL